MNDFKEIKERYSANKIWEKNTAKYLMEEVANVLGTDEWHFNPRFYSSDMTDKIAGLRVVEGKIQYCSACRGSYRIITKDGQITRIPTWMWLEWRWKRLSWIILLYEIMESVKDTATKHEQIKGDYCGTDYKSLENGVDCHTI